MPNTDSPVDSMDVEEHDCFQHAIWRPEDVGAVDPVPGDCEICGEELEHYCDESFPTDADFMNVVDHGVNDEPIFGVEYDCEFCSRTLETRFQKKGTWDVDSNKKVYGA